MSIRCIDCGKLIFSFRKTRCSDCQSLFNLTERKARSESFRLGLERERQERLARNIHSGNAKRVAAHRGDVVSTTQEDFGDVVVKTYETAPSIWSASHSSEPARCSDHYSYTSHSSSSCSSYGDSGGSSSCSSSGCD